MVKRFISFIGLFLACILFVSAKSAFVKVTDASKLATGDVIILASSAQRKAAAALGGNKYFSAVNATFTGNTVVCEDAIQFTLVQAGNLWLLNTLDGDQWKNVWAMSAKALTLNYETGYKNVWTISIDEDGFATIASTDSTYGRFLYNVQSPRFLNYGYNTTTSVSMVLPEIYRLQEVADDAVDAPSFSIPAGNYYEAQNVEITSEVEGVNIWYKFNDDAEFTQYTAPLVVSADALITAYAELEGKKSEEISAKYFIAKSYTLAEVEELAAENQPIVLNLENAVIDSIYVSSKEKRNGVYLTAGTTAIEIYAYDVPEEWVAGGTITGAVKGLWKEYNGIKEVCPSDWEGLTYTAPKVIPTELQNGTFDDAADLVTENVRTYEKDKTGTDVAWMQPVSGWEIVSNGDARAAGVFAYGSQNFIGGAGYVAPAADPAGESEGGCLGILGVWTGLAVYTQEVSMPAGDYNFTYFVYNVGGTNAVDQNNFGVVVGDKAIYGDAKTFPVNAWTEYSVPFTVAEDGTIVTFSLGYVAANAGSAAMPHLFVDNVTVEKVTSIDTTPLTDAIAAAQETLAGYAEGSESYTILSEAIAAAQAAVETVASYDDLAAAIDALKAGENAAAKVMYAKIEDGDYYLYNEEAEQFFFAGNSWGTQASFGEHGFPVTLTQNADGTYTIDTHINPSNNGNHFLNTDAQGGYFVDSPVGNWFIFETEGTYQFSRDGVNFMAFDGTSVIAKVQDKTAPEAQWTLVTKADFLAEFANASAQDPVDATFLITNPNFTRGGNQGVWTVEDCSNKNLAGGNQNNMCAESWRSTFTIYQTLTDIPNGFYVLDAQAAVTDYDNVGTDLPVVFANEATATFPLMTNGENALGQLSDAFLAGKYQVEPILVEVTDGTLKVGVKCGRNNTWSTWDNFELYYIGTPETMYDGTYYLYNEASNKFASRGAAWNTAGFAGDFGYAVILDVDAEGKTQIKYSDWTNANLGLDAQGGMYTDIGNATYWQFALDAETGEATFNLNGKFLGIAENGNLVLVDSANVCTWQLVGPEDYMEIVAANQRNQFLAVLEAAGMTEEDFALCANVDMTSSIQSASLINGTTGWTWTAYQRGGNIATNENGAETWQGCGALTQTVEGLASGIYKVSMNALYRDGHNGDVYGRYNQGIVNVPGYLSANGSKVQFADWAAYAEQNGTAYKPNSMAEAKALFDEGKYLIETYAFVGEDGKLALEISQPGFVGDCWLMMANVQLAYVASSVSDEQIETLIASIPETPYNAELKAEVNAAAEALAASKSLADYQALSELLPAAKESADIYANINNEAAKAEAFDAAGQAKFAELAADALNAYAEESITDGKEELAAIEAALIEACKAQTTPGSDMTLVVANADCTSL
ncbi:MAG: chitobiase/beta-hexosaminidase C-terminal domain-containing protein, partial [Bacteroidaceae bacterium]|nr:chitobiase/beta-hexosaminidase C-terminal domain-containing protein [Bacteroidaceae bacterium]